MSCVYNSATLFCILQAYTTPPNRRTHMYSFIFGAALFQSISINYRMSNPRKTNEVVFCCLFSLCLQATVVEQAVLKELHSALTIVDKTNWNAVKHVPLRHSNALAKALLQQASAESPQPIADADAWPAPAWAEIPPVESSTEIVPASSGYVTDLVGKLTDLVQA